MSVTSRANLQTEYDILFDELDNFQVLQQYGINIPEEDLMDPTLKRNASDRQASGVVLGKPSADSENSGAVQPFTAIEGGQSSKNQGGLQIE